MVSEAEAKEACCEVPIIAPGSDKIDVFLLNRAWQHIARAVTALYDACLSVGYYLTAFRSAEVVFLPRPNKDNYTLHFGALPSREALDLVSALAHDVERHIATKGNVLTLLTLDVEGAFNAIFRNYFT
ncbi:hypothetical protein GQX73_g10886 [Xylaria multiplex]|uniref:Reverse transcriptase domain-containing protein n=1 Tax=Xylaria multiplex TaxID=323545 RepID=A0A7C8MKY3_9PEZI|nr:hypothetical protein GQX73_g10886 [Xylaria multiplex]